jgi:myo-inositol 2-dehydrogenase / D-chiro-inositol 1-dehydrogenase
MPHPDQIRVIVVGAGRIGELHARNIVSRLPEFELVAVVEPSPKPEIAEWLGSIGVALYDTVSGAIAGTEVDAILVAVPTDLHEEVAVTAIHAGLAVFCEKPVAPDIPAARRIVDAAERAGVPLQIGFNRRFDHNFAALRGSVIDGRIGKVEMIRVTSRDPGPPPIEYIKRSGGLFMDMTIHDFDMARFLSGDEFAEVHAIGASIVDPAIGRAGDIDSAVVSFKTSGGAIGVIENSRRAAYGYDQRAELLGSLGATLSANDAPSTIVVSDAAGVHGQKPLHFFLERYSDSFIAELAAFAAAIREGTSPPVTGLDGIEAMRIAAACSKSIVERRQVSLEEIER